MFLFSLAPNEVAAKPLAGTAMRAATPRAMTTSVRRPSLRLVLWVLVLVIGGLLSSCSFPTTAVSGGGPFATRRPRAGRPPLPGWFDSPLGVAQWLQLALRHE